MEFTTTQVFNRRSIAYLYDKRSELDPGQAEIIKSIYNNKKKLGMQGALTVTYRLAKSVAGKLGFGRLYGTKGSLETLERECRGTICKEFYIDIDIVNCHPVILSQFAKRNYNVDLPQVEKYVQNREEYLKAIIEENDCNKDQAKQVIISIVYGNGCNKDSFLAELSEEVRNFSKMLFRKPEYKALADSLKSEKNLYGSFLSYVLQTEERHCMIAMMTMLTNAGCSVDVLCYDGVMIRKNENITNIEQLLLGCEAFVKAKTNYDIKLTTKEFQSYDLPAIGEEMVPGVTKEAYEAMKADFELNHFYHSPSDTFVEIDEKANMNFMSSSHASELLNPKWCFALSKKFNDTVPFLDIWRKDPNRKICTEVSFKESENPKVFTLPITFAYKSVTIDYEKVDDNGEEVWNDNKSDEIIDLFTQLVNLNTNHNEILKTYVLDWLAHLLQKPTDLPGVGLIMTGEKGVGKDTLGDFLQEFIVGKHLSTNYTTNKQFFGTHDMGKLNKFLIKLEETSRKDCFDNSSELKATITASQITVNPKGLKEITADNFARYIFTTNKANPVDMSDGERRFVLLVCSSERKGDYAFWTKIRKELFNPEAGRIIADYLLDRNIDKFEVRKLPANEFQNSIIQSEKSSEEKFIEHWEGERTNATDLYQEYMEFCNKNFLVMAKNVAWFSKSLQTYVRNGTILNTSVGNVSYYLKPGNYCINIIDKTLTDGK